MALDLTLDDLDLNLDFKAKSKKAKRLAKKDGPPLRQPAKTVKHVSVWKAEAVVLVVFYGKCSHCFSQWEHPQEELLVRFRHKRKPDTLWEVADHPAAQNKTLPRILRRIPMAIRRCQHCWYPDEIIETGRAFHPPVCSKTLVPTTGSNMDSISELQHLKWDILNREIDS